MRPDCQWQPRPPWLRGNWDAHSLGAMSIRIAWRLRWTRCWASPMRPKGIAVIGDGRHSARIYWHQVSISAPASCNEPSTRSAIPNHCRASTSRLRQVQWRKVTQCSVQFLDTAVGPSWRTLQSFALEGLGSVTSLVCVLRPHDPASSYFTLGPADVLYFFHVQTLRGTRTAAHNHCQLLVQNLPSHC